MDTLQRCEIRDHSRRQEKAYSLTVRKLFQTKSGESSLEVLSVASLQDVARLLEVVFCVCVCVLCGLCERL